LQGTFQGVATYKEHQNDKGEPERSPSSASDVDLIIHAERLRRRQHRDVDGDGGKSNRHMNNGPGSPTLTSGFPKKYPEWHDEHLRHPIGHAALPPAISPPPVSASLTTPPQHYKPTTRTAYRYRYPSLRTTLRGPRWPPNWEVHARHLLRVPDQSRRETATQRSAPPAPIRLVSQRRRPPHSINAATPEAA